jgi:Lhr-like helicase
MSLEHFEEVEHIVLSQVQKMSSEKKSSLMSVIDERLRKWRDCYEGRRMYRMACERKRDPKHDAAYWFFKLAYLSGKIIQMNASNI